VSATVSSPEQWIHLGRRCFAAQAKPKLKPEHKPSPKTVSGSRPSLAGLLLSLRWAGQTLVATHLFDIYLA